MSSAKAYSQDEQKEVFQKNIEKEVLLKTILYLIQTEYEKKTAEADRSYELLNQIGEKTELVKELEKAIDNPFDFFYNNVSQMDSQVSKVIETAVETFLKHSTASIISVHKNINERILNYCIELHEDNSKQRDIIFKFLDYFETTKLSHIYEVNFHFIPSDMISSLEEVKKVELIKP